MPIGTQMMDWSTEKLTEWLIVWVTNGPPDWVLDWGSEWRKDLLTQWLIDWMIDWLMNWLIGWLIGEVTYWRMERVTCWLSYCRTDSLIDWLIDGLIHWLMDCVTEWWWLPRLVRRPRLVAPSSYTKREKKSNLHSRRRFVRAPAVIAHENKEKPTKGHTTRNRKLRPSSVRNPVWTPPAWRYTIPHNIGQCRKLNKCEESSLFTASPVMVLSSQ